MAGHDTSGPDWLARRRRYRRAMIGVVLVGVLGLGLADALGYPLLGVAIYWAGFLGIFAVRRRSPVPLFDERDCALERRASYDALRVTGVALVVVGPGAVGLAEAGYVEVPPALTGAIWAYVALFAVFGVAYLARRHRP